MIQRMGRVLRKKLNGGSARLFLLYAKDTHEDPDRGAHETFLEVISPVADEVLICEAGDPRLRDVWN